VSSAAAYSLRKLRQLYSGSAIRIRRSSDNAEQDIGFASTTQTRTNLMPVPLVDNGTALAGITATQVGSGVEFGLPYIDIQWQGIAIAAGVLSFRQGSANTYDPAIHAEVVVGSVYTGSVSYRLIAGTAPTQQLTARLIQRQTNATGVSFGTVYNQPAPTNTIQRAVCMDVIQANVRYAHMQFGYSLIIGDTVNVTIRFYANNLEEGIGNIRPLLQRNVSEVVASVGDLDVNTLNHFVNQDNLLTFSEDFTNAGYVQAGFTSVTANNATAPNGTLTAETVIENTATSTQHRFSRSITLNSGFTYTFSCYVKQGAGSRQFQLGVSGSSLVGRAYFNLTNGTIDTVDQGTATMTDVGNGWYRVSLTVLTVATVSHSLFFAMTNGTTFGSETYNGDGTSSIQIWGSQLNQGQLADYQPTTTTAISLATAQNGFVTTWYDQSGNNRNATQTTASNQPSIIVTGSVNSENGHPSVLYNGTTTHLSATIPLEVETTNLFVALNGNQPVGGSTHKALLAGNGTSFLATGTTYGFSYSTSTTVLGISLGNGTTEQRADAPNTVTNALEVIGFTRTGNSTRILRNGVLGTAGTQDRTTGFTSGYNIGADPSSTRYYTGRISEITLFTSALSTTDRQTLERNQGAYYSISVA
jgi:hypothetical protein